MKLFIILVLIAFAGLVAELTGGLLLASSTHYDGTKRWILNVLYEYGPPVKNIGLFLSGIVGLIMFVITFIL